MTRDRPTKASDDTVTPLLRAWQNGDPEAADRLIPLVYAELRSLAGRHMRAERDGHTLQPTALVNEAFVRLVDQRSTEWQGRAHFLAIGSRIMRRILVDHSRRRSAGKRDGGIQITLGDSLSAEQPTALDLLVVDDALSRLAAIDERKAGSSSSGSSVVSRTPRSPRCWASPPPRSSATGSSPRPGSNVSWTTDPGAA
jgi:RNA polymerase sigma-70 factor, ECF subfamily